MYGAAGKDVRCVRSLSAVHPLAYEAGQNLLLANVLPQGIASGRTNL
jgi:hypothetical protein